MVRLKNGAQEAHVAVITIMSDLMDLCDIDPIAVYELHQRCKDPGHKFWGNYEETLKARGFLSVDGNIVGSTLKNVLTSAFVSEGNWDFSLETPIAKPPIAGVDFS